MGLFKFNLTCTNIIPIVNYAGGGSFPRVRSNLKAIRERGWGPLNQILLSHPDIVNGSNDDIFVGTSSESCPDSPDITNIVSNDNSITTSATSTPQSTPTGEKKIDPLISRISTSLTALLVKLCAPS